MRSLNTWRLLALFLSTGILAIAYAWQLSWGWALPFIFLALFVWLGAEKLDLPVGDFVFIACLSAAMLGVIQDIHLVPLLLATLAALAWWDLDHFYHRMHKMTESDATRRLMAAHYQRLLAVLGIGLAISLAAAVISIPLSLGWAMILILVFIVCIRLGLNAIDRGLKEEIE